MANTTMKHDAIYARYSSHAQDDGTSIEVQLEQCERAAGGKCKHYIDRARTGRAVAGRPELQRLIADAEAGKIGRVFLYKYDRLGRAAATHAIVEDLEYAGVEVVSATEGTNALARGVNLVVAADYSRQLADRTRDGLMKRFEQGGHTGGMAPFGYRIVTRDGRRVLAIDPDEAKIVREAVHWYLSETAGFKLIARRFRQRAIKSRRGAGWSFTSIRSLLLNPILGGRIRFNVRKMQLDRRTGRRVPRFKDHAEHLERLDESLRIVDEPTFKRLQGRISKSAGQGRGRRGTSHFTGLVYCECGARCHKVTSRNAKGEYSYYVCSRALRYEDCKLARRVREDLLMGMVQDRFAHLHKHRDKIIARAIEVATEAARGNRDDADRIRADLAELERQQARDLELLRDRDLSAATKQAINRQMAGAEERRQLLQAALDALCTQATADVEGLAKLVREVFDDAQRSLASIHTPEEFNRFVEDFVGPMTILADGSVAQRKLPPADARGNLQSSIAGACFVPCQSADSAMTAGFWRFARAA